MKGLYWLLLFVPGLVWPMDQGDFRVDAGNDEVSSLKVLWVSSTGWAEAGPDGQPEGFTIDLMRAFADWLERTHRITVDLQFTEEADWRVFYDRVRSAGGGVFGLGNVTITEPRREELSFSPPYVHNVAVLISHRERGEVLKPELVPEILVGLRAMAFEGTLHERRLQALKENFWPDLPMDFSASNQAILDAAAADTHFAYIDGYNYLQARNAGAPLRRHPALDDANESFGVIMPQDNDWQPLLAEFFAENGGLSMQPWYRASLKRHLGEEIADLMSVQPQ